MKTVVLVCLLSTVLLGLNLSLPLLGAEPPSAPSQGPPQGPPAAVPATAADILRTFQSYFLNIDTIFLERPVIADALAKRPEFQAWRLVRTDNPGAADVVILFTLPALTWQWNYRMTHARTGQVLAFGRVNALEEYEASALLAADIASAIAISRGYAPSVGAAPTSAVITALGAKQWSLKGAGQPIPEGQDVSLSITRDFLYFSGASVPPFQIPTRNLLYAYHLQLQNVQRDREIEKWEKGWDQACMATSSDSGCLALLGLPLYLIGELLLRTTDYGPSDFIVLRIQDGQAVSELSFLTSTSEWPAIIADLQAVIPGKEEHPVIEARELRKNFDTAKENAVQILLQVPVEVGRWPTLEPGDYKLVINEHSQGRADVFFYRLPSVDFTKPRAVAAAQAFKLSPPMPDSKITFLEKGSLRFLDEVRVGSYLLRFD